MRSPAMVVFALEASRMFEPRSRRAGRKSPILCNVTDLYACRTIRPSPGGSSALHARPVPNSTRGLEIPADAGPRIARRSEGRGHGLGSISQGRMPEQDCFECFHFSVRGESHRFCQGSHVPPPCCPRDSVNLRLAAGLPRRSRLASGRVSRLDWSPDRRTANCHTTAGRKLHPPPSAAASPAQIAHGKKGLHAREPVPPERGIRAASSSPGTIFHGSPQPPRWNHRA